MPTAYLVTYGVDPSDRFAAYAFKDRKTAQTASLPKARLVPGVPSGNHAGGCAYVIQSEKDITFGGSLLVNVYNRLTRKNIKGFLNRANGVSKVFSALRDLQIDPTVQKKLEKAMSEADQNETTTKTKTKKAKAEKTADASNGASRAWKDYSDEDKIFLKVDGCPRREGSAAATHWALYRDGMTIRELRAAGGEASRLKTDLSKDRLELERAPESATA
jgi:hypothetical protein